MNAEKKFKETLRKFFLGLSLFLFPTNICFSTPVWFEFMNRPPHYLCGPSDTTSGGALLFCRQKVKWTLYQNLQNSFQILIGYQNRENVFNTLLVFLDPSNAMAFFMTLCYLPLS